MSMMRAAVNEHIEPSIEETERFFISVVPRPEMAVVSPTFRPDNSRVFFDGSDLFSSSSQKFPYAASTRAHDASVSITCLDTISPASNTRSDFLASSTNLPGSYDTSQGCACQR